MNKSIPIFKIDGIVIKLHYSWFIIFGLLWYSLSVDFFPLSFPGYSVFSYIMMGLSAAFLLFVSVILHELMHSIVAKSMHINVKEITLFFFGGVANISTEKLKPKTEFWTAISGPLLSIYLGILFYFLSILFSGFLFFYPILVYAYKINLTLGIFNLLPGYPLDGGRVLRSIIHWKTHNLMKATYIASKAGRFIAGAMIFFGIFGFFIGVNALWFLILGVFLYLLAGASYEQTLVMEILDKQKLIIEKAPVVQPSQKVIDLINRHYLKEHEFVVVKSRKYLGVINLNDLSKFPKQVWEAVKVEKIIAHPKTVSRNDKLFKAYSLMVEQTIGIIPVVENEKLLGVVRARTVNNFINKKVNFS